MNRQQFSVWAKNIRDHTFRDIRIIMYETGKTPEAIIAGGEYQYAFVDDCREVQRTTDGGLLWRGIPLIRSGPVNKVMVVWNMHSLDLPQPPPEVE